MLENLNIGSIETFYKTVNKIVDPITLYDFMSRSASDSFLFESADIREGSGQRSIICTEPCLKITIKSNLFTILALTPTGNKFLAAIKDDFSFATNLTITPNQISGTIEKETHLIDEESRLKQKNIFDVLRTVVFKFKPRIKLNFPSSGLFGAIGYNSIDYFETLPATEKSNLPDMEFYFADKLIVLDHLQHKTYLISNLLVSNEKSKEDHYKCIETINKYEKILTKLSEFNKNQPVKREITPAINDDDFKNIVKNAKQHILEGDIFQIVISRSFNVKTNEDHLQIYSRLKDINPGPYMFLFKNRSYTLLGSSPETAVKVSKRIVEIKPIAGTVRRSKNIELDSRLELQLLLDRKELAEHCMLVDLARNDIAKISKPGTRITPQLVQIEKYSHVQHLVSKVQGTLRDDLDALHAYIATMNMGTLTGAPKIKAMQLIRKYEKNNRDFYGGSICYLTPDGEFDSCIIIRAITLQEDVAKVQAGAGIVHDSVPQNEADETLNKAKACLKALGALK
jgi:anthranilate synthase component I